MPGSHASGHAAGVQLAQVRGSASAGTIYSPTIRTEITSMFVCNTTASAANFRLFHDDDGATFDQTTALFYDVAVPGNATVEIASGYNSGGVMVSIGGALGFYSSTDLALTISVYGITAHLAEI